MVLTKSTMPQLGDSAPDFRLPDTTDPEGRECALAEFADAKALLVAFICNHCPYVVHYKEALAAFAREYAEKGLKVVAISANDPASHPADAPERMAEDAKRYGYIFPYLFDESQEVAKAYRAACTPDFFLYDGARKLFYAGRFDDSSPGRDAPITGADMRAAVEALLAGAAPPQPQIPSMGCNIKWKPGNAPDYFA